MAAGYLMSLGPMRISTHRTSKGVYLEVAICCAKDRREEGRHTKITVVACSQVAKARHVNAH